MRYLVGLVLVGWLLASCAETNPYDTSPATLKAYGDAGRRSVEMKRFRAQIMGDLDAYSALDGEGKKIIEDANQLRIDRAYLEKQNTEESVKEIHLLDKKINRAQELLKQHKQKMAVYKKNILDLAKDDKGNITNQPLHNALSHWLDPNATAGQRAGIEEGLGLKAGTEQEINEGDRRKGFTCLALPGGLIDCH